MHELLTIPKSYQEAIELQEKWQHLIYPVDCQQNRIIEESYF